MKGKASLVCVMLLCLMLLFAMTSQAQGPDMSRAPWRDAPGGRGENTLLKPDTALQDDPYPGATNTPTHTLTPSPTATNTLSPDTPTATPPVPNTPTATPPGAYPPPETVIPTGRLLLPLIYRSTPTDPVTCTRDLVVNGGFETDEAWNIPDTEYPAAYTTAAAFEGLRSMRLGIEHVAHNRHSYSSVNQQVSIPVDAISATLSFHIYPWSGEPGPIPTPYPRGQVTPLADGLPYDVQYLLLLDQHGNWIDTLLWQASNARSDQLWQVDLLPYAGQTIKLHFGVYNSGDGSVTGMYLDGVSLMVTAPSLCLPATPTSTPWKTATPTRTYTPTPTHTPSPVCSPVPDIIWNGSFEHWGGWHIPITAYSAGYSTAQARTGAWSMRLGIPPGGTHVESYSDTNQTVYIPTDTRSAKLVYWAYRLSGNPGPVPTPAPRLLGEELSAATMGHDVQYLLILNTNDTWIDSLMWEASDYPFWTRYEYDLTSYAGRTIKLHFGVYNTGTGGRTSMYIDNVQLLVDAPSLCP
jgi:hypothetical protein